MRTLRVRDPPVYSNKEKQMPERLRQSSVKLFHSQHFLNTSKARCKLFFRGKAADISKLWGMPNYLDMLPSLRISKQ